MPNNTLPTTQNLGNLTSTIMVAGEVAGSSPSFGVANDVINLNNQAAGIYFVQAYQFNGDTSYNLAVNAL